MDLGNQYNLPPNLWWSTWPSFHSVPRKVAQDKCPHFEERSPPGTVEKTSALLKFCGAFITVCKVKCLSARNARLASLQFALKARCLLSAGMFIVSIVYYATSLAPEIIHYQRAGLSHQSADSCEGGKCPKLLHQLIDKIDNLFCGRREVLLQYITKILENGTQSASVLPHTLLNWFSSFSSFDSYMTTFLQH